MRTNGLFISSVCRGIIPTMSVKRKHINTDNQSEVLNWKKDNKTLSSEHGME